MPEAHGGSGRPKDEVKALLRKAEQGNTTVLPALRAYMETCPGYWEQVGDLAAAAQRALIQQAIGPQDLVAQEAVARKCAALSTELAGATPAPLERLLVERIVLCWLQLYAAEALYTQMKDLTFRQAEFHQQRISTAQARYLAAIRTLAQIRRLGVPAVQVNIGGQQVNVAG